jgi:hypothetical protein
MYFVYTPLSGAVELIMGNHSCGGSHGRACNMLFMMKIDDGLTLCW